MISEEDQESPENATPLASLALSCEHGAERRLLNYASACTFRVWIESFPTGSVNKAISTSGILRIEDGMAAASWKAPIAMLPYPLCGRTVSEQVPLGQIKNVAQHGNEVSFDDMTGLTPRRAVLKAADAEEAERIVALLPTEMTPEFIAQAKEHLEFFLAVVKATPSAFVTPVIVALNILVFIATGIAGAGWFSSDPQRLIACGADYWPLTTGGQWWRLGTSAFMHCGILHLAFNMWAFANLGAMVERLYGNRFYAGIYAFGAILSGLASIAWERELPCAGASGAIFAVYGAMVAYLICQPRTFPQGAVRPMLKGILIFIGFNVVYGLAHRGISNSAHLGGLTAGLVLGMVLCRPLTAPRRAAQAIPRFILGAILAIAAVLTAVYYLPKAGAGQIRHAVSQTP